jgi:glycine/D-amino acid oxidase-like deaminating enzyme
VKRIRNFPRPDTGNGWENNLTPRVVAPALNADLTADWLVIGAGFAGLTAARRLAENRPDEHVVLVDACEIATGASARNSGFVIDIPHNVGGDDGGIAEAQRALRLARSATEWLHDIVKTHQIECQWSPKGQYMAASSPEGAATLDEFTAGLDLIDEPYQNHDVNLRGMIGSDYYSRIIHTPGTVLMQPAHQGGDLA